MPDPNTTIAIPRFRHARRDVQIPSCLSHLAQERRWVVWSWETKQKKSTKPAGTARPQKPTKPPRQAIGGRVGNYAYNDKPETWATLAEAQAAFATGKCDGIGLQLLGLKGFAAIDLDDVRSESGLYLPWARTLIDDAGSYAEHTPSGQGGRMLGKIPDDFPTIHTVIQHPQGGKFEIYTNLVEGHARYITVTGDQIETLYADLVSLEATVTKLLEFSEKKAPGNQLNPETSYTNDIKAFNSLPSWVKDFIQHGGTGDRSADFQSVVNALRPRGWSFDAALRLFQKNPNGPAAKYIAGDRLEGELRRSWNKAKAPQIHGIRSDLDVGNDPVDLWGVFPPPELPRGFLPPLIDEFAIVQGEQMGADPAGLAMAALCTCAAAIPDRITLKVKRHDNWLESARIWVALVGSPSTKKSPIVNAASAPLRSIDARLLKRWIAAVERYDQLSPEEKKGNQRPKQNRLRIEDTTVEAAQQVLEGSVDGILCYQDELAGFFGAMDKYSGGKGAAADRAFWLRAFNGGEYALNRVGRGVTLIPNLSVCLLGGIQPEPIRKLAADAQDDGLLQRLFPIILKPATLGKDEPKPDVASIYASAIEALHILRRPGNFGMDDLTFDDGAQAIRLELEAKHLAMQSTEMVSAKLASHIGKYDGLFARLCIVWHCLEHVAGATTKDGHHTAVELSSVITEDTARRVAYFLEHFLLPHAITFYGSVLGLSDDHNRLAAIAGHILSHKLERVTNRDVQRGDRAMRGLTEKEIRPLLEQLAALGWLYQIEAPRPSSPPHWQVNPAVHIKFGDRAKVEAERRATAQKTISELLGKHP